ncbi:Holliday junction branch migration protein RuvA [Endozoicomonadaceae bacterium StTr2]
MIGRLKGILLEKQPPALLLDVNGVGYELEAPMTTIYKLPETGVETILHTHFVVRDDAQLLYGFAEKRERELFRLLIKVNGVGPKVALAILSGLDAETFVGCVQEHDAMALTRIPGIGKKTAERLIVEMKDKLGSWQTSAATSLPGLMEASGNLEQGRQAAADAVSALEALGYKAQDASKAIKAVMEDGLDSQELIRRALKQMI